MNLLSIIVPVYKAEAYLRECIESIINQKYRDFELILVDDGSPDRCPEICDEYAGKDSRVLVLHQCNQGSVDARKNGLMVAKGKYITFVDADDWIDEDYHAKIMEKLADKTVDMIITGYCEDNSGISVEKDNFIQSGEYRDELLKYLKKNAICGGAFYTPGIVPVLWNKVIRKEIVCKAYESVPSSIRMGDDAAVIYPALNASEYVIVDNTTHGYHYRITPASLSKTFDDSYFDGICALLQYLDNTLKNSEEMADQLVYYRLFLLLLGISPMLKREYRIHPINMIKMFHQQVSRFELGEKANTIDWSIFSEKDKRCCQALINGSLIEYLLNR